MKAFNDAHRINEITIAQDTHNVWIHITQRSFLHDWFLPFLSAIPCLYLLSKRLWCVDKKGNFNTMEHQFWNNTKAKDVITTNMKRIITVFVILFCLVFTFVFAVSYRVKIWRTTPLSINIHKSLSRLIYKLDIQGFL